MQALKLCVVIAALVLISIAAVANEPVESMASQCEQYGSYQDAEGQWQSCEYEEQGEYEESNLQDEPDYVEDEPEED
jgi:hypothetical protein